MSTTLAHPKISATDRSALEAFWSSVDGLNRAVPKIRSLSQDVLLGSVPDKAGRPITRAALARDIERLRQQITDIGERLSQPSVEQAQHSTQHQAASGHLQRLVKTGQLVSATAFAEGLHVTRQALSKALAAKRVFYVEVQGARMFPSFFLDPSCERRHLELVSKALGELPGATKLQFFATGKASLSGKTPLQALADGKLADVRRAAAGFAER